MKKTLLVITGSSWQIPIITKAKEMGIRVLVTDRSPNAPAFGLADGTLIADSFAKETILEWAKSNKISGVISEQTDVGVTTAAYISENLGLPGISYEASQAATNKHIMREVCRDAGVPIPRFEKAVTLDEATNAAASIGYPIVIKPTDAQASRGVAKVWKAEDLPYWFNNAKKHSTSGVLLVEEMLEGCESSVEAFNSNGKITTLGICDKTKCPPPHSFDVQLIYPGRFSQAVLEELENVNMKVIKAIGITHGFSHAEYIVTNRGVKLLEIAARGCGSGVATTLLPAMTGIDLISCRIRQALGDNPRLELPKLVKYGILEFLLLPEGKLTQLSGISAAKQVPGVIALGFKYGIGDIIQPPKSGDQRPGYFHAVADSHAELLKISAQVKAAISADITPPEQIIA